MPLSIKHVTFDRLRTHCKELAGYVYSTLPIGQCCPYIIRAYGQRLRNCTLP